MRKIQFAKPFLVFAIFAGLSSAGHAFIEKSPCVDFSQIEEATNDYLSALTHRDYEAYLDSLVPIARQEPALGSIAAMLFWRDELMDEVARGFTGNFKILITKLPEKFDEHFLMGAYALFLDRDGFSMNSGLTLGFSNGIWKAIYLE